MRRLTRALSASAVVVAMTACGGGSTPAPARTPTPTGRSQPAVFPVTITRTGGIAGFQDRLTVAGDGLVSVTRRGQAPRRCRLTPAAAMRLTTAASEVPWSRVTSASTAPSFPDDLVTMVQSPAGGPVRLEDPMTGQAGQVFLELLSDLFGGAASARTCPPV